MVRINFDGININISISIEDILISQKYRPDNFGYSIEDVDKLANFICNNLLSFTTNPSRKEAGISDIEKLIDDLILYAYENGENWLLAYKQPESEK